MQLDIYFLVFDLLLMVMIWASTLRAKAKIILGRINLIVFH